MCLYGNWAGYPWSQGPMTYSPLGDGCPAALGLAGNLEDNMVNDGLNNMFVMDNSNTVLHELTLGTVFPATPVNTHGQRNTSTAITAVVTQAIQVHFDGGIPVNYAGNPPPPPGNPPAGLVSAGFFASAPGFTTTAFSIVSPTNDFSIDTTDAEFPLGSLITPQNEAFGNSALTPNFFMWAGLPTCTQLGISGGDVGYDCLVYVSFTPPRRDCVRRCWSPLPRMARSTTSRVGGHRPGARSWPSMAASRTSCRHRPGRQSYRDRHRPNRQCLHRRPTATT